ncbi:MAG: nuclear transport factor 2 family protein [Actinomycetota bacterium]|nr:nuclear transport factor 2 family protein [Actinomycetota bacterium]
MSLEAFRNAAESLDAEAMAACLSPDVVFHSPVVFKTYRGREEVLPILMAVSTVFEDFTYIGEYRSEDGGVLHFQAKIGDRAVDGVDILHFGPDGLADEFTVMIRPFSGATALRDRMAALLEALPQAPA